MAAKDPLHELLALAATFVVRQKGRWNHAEWEEFVQQASDLGFPINDETKRYLGNIVEASKDLYPMAESLHKVPASRATSKPKTKVQLRRG